MEIAPIPGMRAVAAVRPREVEMRAPAIFDLDPSSRPDDGERQRNGKQAAGAEENGEDDFLIDGETASNTDEMEGPPARQVDYFA